MHPPPGLGTVSLAFVIEGVNGGLFRTFALIPSHVESRDRIIGCDTPVPECIRQSAGKDRDDQRTIDVNIDISLTQAPFRVRR
jgi:hypothetical protein